MKKNSNGIKEIIKNSAIGTIAGCLALIVVLIIFVFFGFDEIYLYIIGFPIAIIFGLIGHKKQEKFVQTSSLSMTLLLVLIGIFLIYTSYNTELWENVPWKTDVVSLGATTIGAAIGFWALYVSLEARRISKKSEEQITSIANLQFYEKMAILENYLYQVKARLPVNVEVLYNDIKGASQLKKYVNPEIEKKLNNKIQELINNALLYQPYRELVKRLHEFQKEEYPNSI